MIYGPNSNEFKKNWSGAQKTWSPVFKKYGYGKKLLDKVWFNFSVPKQNLLFDQQIIRCEIVELAHIINHKHKFDNQAPLSDVKYASTSQRELQDMLILKTSNSKRLTKIYNDKDYINRETQNCPSFNHNLETILGKTKFQSLF